MRHLTWWQNKKQEFRSKTRDFLNKALNIWNGVATLINIVSNIYYTCVPHLFQHVDLINFPAISGWCNSRTNYRCWCIFRRLCRFGFIVVPSTGRRYEFAGLILGTLRISTKIAALLSRWGNSDGKKSMVIVIVACVVLTCCCVDWTFLRIWSKWPLTMGRDAVGYLRSVVADKPGKFVK